MPTKTKSKFYISILGTTFCITEGLNRTHYHPLDCSRYIKCGENTATEFKCINNLVYSLQLDSCVPRQNVTCANSLPSQKFTHTFSSSTEISEPTMLETLDLLPSSETGNMSIDFITHRTALASYEPSSSFTETGKHLQLYRDMSKRLKQG